VCPQEREEGTTRPCNASWRGHDGLVHPLLAAPDRSISFIRRLEVHDQKSEYKLHVFQALGLPAIQGPPFVHVVQFSQNPHKLTVVQCYSDLLICVDRIISLQRPGQEASITKSWSDLTSSEQYKDSQCG